MRGLLPWLAIACLAGCSDFKKGGTQAVFTLEEKYTPLEQLNLEDTFQKLMLLAEKRGLDIDRVFIFKHPPEEKPAKQKYILQINGKSNFDLVKTLASNVHLEIAQPWPGQMKAIDKLSLIGPGQRDTYLGERFINGVDIQSVSFNVKTRQIIFEIKETSRLKLESLAGKAVLLVNNQVMSIRNLGGALRADRFFTMPLTGAALLSQPLLEVALLEVDFNVVSQKRLTKTLFEQTEEFRKESFKLPGK